MVRQQNYEGAFTQQFCQVSGPPHSNLPLSVRTQKAQLTEIVEGKSGDEMLLSMTRNTKAHLHSCWNMNDEEIYIVQLKTLQ